MAIMLGIVSTQACADASPPLARQHMGSDAPAADPAPGAATSDPKDMDPADAYH
jgi:hypothetical protein